MPKAPSNPQAAYAKALRRIKACRKAGKQEVVLDLEGLGLTELPPEIGQLTHLRCLAAALNKLTSLPSEIGQLSNLTRLDVCANHLTGLPPEIGQLQALEELDATNNRLALLPPELARLKSLKHLYLHVNPDLDFEDQVLGPTWHHCYYCDARPASAQDILNSYFNRQRRESP